MNKSLNDTNFLILPDGRKLCYAEYGDPDGTPVMLVHGNPNSRLLWGVMPGSPFLPGIHLIAPDRPGYGQSEFKAGVTTVENWPNDVVALSDHLGIEKFILFGPSGGGPFALACAWKIPERLSSVGVFASVGPLLPETVGQLARPVKMMWENAPRLPGVFRLQMRLFAWLARKYPNLYVKMILSELSKTDRENYIRLDLASTLGPDRVEAYHQSGIGTWYDVMIPSNWPIPLEDIKVKMHLWQGEEDISVPLVMGQYIAGKIPDCEAKYIKGFGHFWIFEHMTEMVETLIDSAEKQKDKNARVSTIQRIRS
ncbi:alpha/beta fold hydrolase [Chloroflexota bacterium]